MTSNDFFERIEAHFNNELPFIVYRKPHQQNLSARLQSNAELNFTVDFTEKGFVFSPFDAIEKTVLIPDAISEIIGVSHVNIESDTEPRQAPKNVWAAFETYALKLVPKVTT